MSVGHIQAWGIKRQRSFALNKPALELLHNSWAEEWGQATRQWHQPKDKKEGALNEDALCFIAVPTAEGVKEMHCFVEADTGSEPDWQIREKIDRYTSYYRKHKMPFRVLFVAPDERRRQELIRVSERSVSKEFGRMYLFTSIEKFRIEPFGAICSICHSENPIRLIPTILASVA